jgi:hypothetical protein
MTGIKDYAIQFIGTQRSGSNLLRLMLNELPEISAPHPPHILKIFFPLLHLYGDLKEADNFETLVTDVCDWVNNNPVPWEGFELNALEIFSLCRDRTMIDLLVSIYRAKADFDGATFWCCKSMESIYYTDNIESSWLKPFYIYLYRDGRDVALSFKKAVVGPKHTYHLASKWKTEQELSLKLIAQLPTSRFIAINYEDMIANPKNTIKAICDKLAVPYTDKVFDYFRSEESRNTARAGAMWRNVTQPIIDNNFNKYEKELTEEDLQLFERVAGDMLNQLGYKTKYRSNTSEPEFSSEQIEEFTILDKVLRERALTEADPGDVNRRKPQELILAEIMSRNKSLHEK